MNEGRKTYKDFSVPIVYACTVCHVTYDPRAAGQGCTEIALHATDQQIMEQRAPLCPGGIQAQADPDALERLWNAAAEQARRELDRAAEQFAENGFQAFKTGDTWRVASNWFDGAGKVPPPHDTSFTGSLLAASEAVSD